MRSRMREHGARAIRLISLPLLCIVGGYWVPAAWADGPPTQPSIYAPVSTPANNILELSWFVVAITGGIFVTVGGLLTWAIIRYRARKTDDNSMSRHRSTAAHRWSWRGR
jgi:heme/copper-type cytochrome/quinol oxidase subunit 2